MLSRHNTNEILIHMREESLISNPEEFNLLKLKIVGLLIIFFWFVAT